MDEIKHQQVNECDLLECSALPMLKASLYSHGGQTHRG
jgi:hypothetical protein